MSDRFLIAPMNIGLQKNVRPWLLPDSAFEKLQNAYIFRGRLRKRFGSYFMSGTGDVDRAQFLSRFRIKVGTTDGAGNLAGNVPGVKFKAGQAFSVSSVMYTVVSEVAGLQDMLATTPTPTAKFNVTNGAYSFVGSGLSTDVYFYPAEPVMGLLTYNVQAINNEELIGFDTQFAYEYTSNGWQRLATGAALWTGSDSEFFWGENHRGILASADVLFVSNYSSGDTIKYWDGATWTNFNPVVNNIGDTIMNARCIASFKNHLLLFNIIESTGTYVNRMRYSQIGSPFEADAWNINVGGKGSFVDAPTKEAIVTVMSLKDRLIVFFERSTYELVYTGNKFEPFVWQQINTELGAESTFSVIPFDKVAIGVGNVGIHSCNGSNVRRIDARIPDEVYKIHNKNRGIYRVYGIRDYKAEMAYWTFPSIGASNIYPDRVLTYNYRTGSWAFNDDSITCFGYWQLPQSTTWNNINSTWQNTATTWDSGTFTAEFRTVVGGNQEGFVFVVDANNTRNSLALQITNIAAIGTTITLTIISHNLKINDYISVEFCENVTGINDSIYAIESVPNANTVTITVPNFGGTYEGLGLAARVSRIDILSKRYNFYIDSGRRVSLESVDFYVDRTANGQITVDILPTATNLSMLEDSKATGAITGTNIVETSPYITEPFEATSERYWHSLYFPMEGETVQLRLFLSDEQMVNSNIAWSNFNLNAILFHASPTSIV